MNFGYARCVKWEVRFSFDSDTGRMLSQTFIYESELNKLLARDDVKIHSIKIHYKYV